MEEFPGNQQHQRDGAESRAGSGRSSRQEPKKVERVTSGDVVRRKKPLGKRFSEMFFGGDTRGTWSFVAWEVFIPAMKETFADVFTQGVERMIFGESRPGSRGRGRGHTNYQRYSSGGRREEPRPQLSRRARATHDFDEIILNTRVEAEEVIDQLFELADRYNEATVADLYDLVGITGNYTDQKYGWTDLRGAGVTHVRNGYLLDLPRPEPLD